MRHFGYAVQWFALALTLFVIYVVTNLRRDADRDHVIERSAQDRRQGRLLVGLALIFFGPLGRIFLFVLWSRLLAPGRPRQTRGDLIVPPRPLPRLALPPPEFRGKKPLRNSSGASGPAIRCSGVRAPSPAAPVCTRRGRCGWRWTGTWIGCSAYSSRRRLLRF